MLLEAMRSMMGSTWGDEEKMGGGGGGREGRDK